jgi:hypothetical protein
MRRREGHAMRRKRLGRVEGELETHLSTGTDDGEGGRQVGRPKRTAGGEGGGEGGEDGRQGRPAGTDDGEAAIREVVGTAGGGASLQQRTRDSRLGKGRALDLDLDLDLDCGLISFKLEGVLEKRVAWGGGLPVDVIQIGGLFSKTC